MKNEPFKLFRVENQETFQGLWYDKNGIFKPFIKKLSNAKCRDIPMEFDPLCKQDGFSWFSACDNLPDMRNWFSYQDLLELSQAGYKLYEFTVPEYKQTNGHAIFTRESVIFQRTLDIKILKATDE